MGLAPVSNFFVYFAFFAANHFYTICTFYTAIIRMVV